LCRDSAAHTHFFLSPTMGKTATVFKDIGKACNDLLTKDYKVGKSTVELKSKTSNGVTFTPTGTKSGDKFSGELKAKYCLSAGPECEVTVADSGVISATIEAADMFMKGLLLSLEAERPAPGKSGLLSKANAIVDYKAEAMTCKASYDCYSGAAAVCGTFATNGVTLGCSADYSTAKSALTKYAAACQLVQPDFTVAAKLATACGKSQTYTGTYYHKVSGDMQVGAELEKSSAKSDVGLAFGCTYKLDGATTVKGKVDSDGILSASYKQVISKLTTMTLAAQIDTVNLSDNKHKFGMVLNLTP